MASSENFDDDGDDDDDDDDVSSSSVAPGASFFFVEEEKRSRKLENRDIARRTARMMFSVVLGRSRERSPRALAAHPSQPTMAPWFDGASFQPGPEMNKIRVWCAAATVRGLVFVFGGFQGETATEVLHAGMAAFLGVGPPTTEERECCEAVELDEARILVVGGWKKRSTEIIDLSVDDTIKVSDGPAMASDRYQCAVVALGDGRILIAGGCGGGDGAPQSTTEILDIETMTFSPGPRMSAARAHCGAVALDRSRVLIAGGAEDPSGAEGGSRSTEVLDLATMTFSAGPDMGARRFGLSMVALDERHVLVVGGMTEREEVDEEANPEGWQAVQIGALRQTEVRPCLPALPLLPVERERPQVLDVEKMAFSPGPPLKDGRCACKAVLLDEGCVLVAGGLDGYEGLATTELLRPLGAAAAPGPAPTYVAEGCAPKEAPARAT